jgi:hypothetical protein
MGAVMAIAVMGESVKPVIPQLILLLKDPAGIVRNQAVSTLYQTDTETRTVIPKFDTLLRNAILDNPNQRSTKKRINRSFSEHIQTEAIVNQMIF